MCFNHDDFVCNNETTMEYMLYIPWCILLIILGIIQIISGTFYFITIPIFKLLFTICTGCWSVLIGIGGSMVICICPSGIKKHEILLYCSVSILILNTINLVMLEFGQLKDIFNESYRNLITETIDYDLLSSQYGRMITTVTALISVLTAFIGAQISFCLLSRYQLIVQKDTRNLRRFNNYNGNNNNNNSTGGGKNKKKNIQMYVNSDQASDLEYVIAKKPTPSTAQQQNEDQTTNIQVYTQSWVFEGGTDDANPDSLSISSTSSYSNSIDEINKKNLNAQRRTSKLSVAGSDRCMLQLTSFSRAATPSPVPNSGQITPYLVNSQCDGMEPSCSKYDNYKLDVKFTKPKNKSKNKVIAVTTQQSADSGNYGALLAELEQSLSEKKMQSLSPDDNSLTISSDKPLSSKSSSKDMEFSKELEAALQLIQELETPSEGPLGGHTNTDELQKSDILRTSSEKTLSAAVSFGELMSPEAPQNPVIVTIISESPYQEK